jgi:hypothetical protein
LRLTRSKSAPPSVYRDPEGAPEIEIHAVRTALRRGAKGSLVTELVVEITQRRRGWFDAEVQRQVDSGDRPLEEDDEGDFTFRRGCTILISPGTMEVRRVIRTQGDIADDEELERVRLFLTREDPAPNNAFHAEPFRGLGEEETIARLHRLAG